MIRIYSIQQALSLKGTIPELAIIRALQFMGDGYDPEDGHIIASQEGDEIDQIIGPINEAEYIDAFIEDGHIVFEVVFQIDDSMTIALIIPDTPWLDPSIRNFLLSASPAPMPLPELKEVTP